jgi:hypothetical protein
VVAAIRLTASGGYDYVGIAASTFAKEDLHGIPALRNLDL